MADDKARRGQKLGLVHFQVDVYENGPAVISVQKHKDFKRISPPVELLNELDKYATRLVGRRKPAAKTGK